MKFSRFADYLERLEKTSKRLEMFEILSDLFKNSSKEEIDKMIYFCQEQLLPPFSGLELGMAEKLIVKAIAKVCGTAEKNVHALYKKLGDLGLVIEQLYKKKPVTLIKPKSLSVEEVYEELVKIAKIGGEGSVDKKINLLAGLFSNCSAKEALYIARFVLGRLRLGIGDPTIMDSLSKAFTGAREFRVEIERAYNLCSDLGLVAKTLAEKGERGIKKFEIKVGSPVRMALAERLPSAEDILKKIGKCAVETKYDGLRCISGFTSIYVKERGLLPVSNVKVGDFILTHNGKFKKVIAKNKRVIGKKERIFKFQTYLGNEFKITEGHRILCNINNKIKWLSVEKIPEKSEVIFPLPKLQKQITPKKVTLRTISNYQKTFQLNTAFFRFLGYWIGDGYSNEYNATNRIGLLFNAKTEEKLCEEYKKLIGKEFAISNFGQSTHNGAIQLYWEDKPFLHWLSHNFRQKWKKGWKGKTLPEWFFSISKEQFLAFLNGWIEADGHTDKLNRTAITTKEASLAVYSQLTGLNFGVIIGIKKIIINDTTYYKLIITKNERKARIKESKVFVKILRKKELSRIGKNREVDPRQVVYNLQVEDDESYCTTMCALHNCQIHKQGNEIEIFSRNQERMTHMFPDIVAGIRKQVSAKTAILEGEAVAFNEETEELFPFQVTITRKRKYDITERVKEFPLILFSFDLLYADGRDLTQEPYEKRIEKLHKIIRKGQTIRFAERIITDNSKKIEEFFEENVEKGAEGIIAKRLDAVYQAGARNFNWIKLKRSYRGELQDTIDVVIVGYIRGRGARAKFGIGALLGAVYDEKADEFKSIAKIGSGLTEEKWVEIRKILDKNKLDKKAGRVDSVLEADVWVQPKIVFTVMADEITKSPIHTAGKQGDEPGFALRFPRIQGWIRPDKKPEDATSVKEISEMFKMQKKVKTISFGA
ncbi:hypothetical protein COS75_03140 [Candidatus Pacearchaeota archaeon CG06_land_8_20_14_3_00_35_12]|nr:MAG: hypothetical protein COS75_03140 [Candidatus Pacearchaeota archaeon CG06_land_8_20_14_3_00_35_12]